MAYCSRIVLFVRVRFCAPVSTSGIGIVVQEFAKLVQYKPARAVLDEHAEEAGHLVVGSLCRREMEHTVRAAQQLTDVERGLVPSLTAEQGICLFTKIKRVLFTSLCSEASTLHFFKSI